MSAAPGGDLLAQLSRVFPYEQCEQMGAHWFISIHAVLDRANTVLGLDWSFENEQVEFQPAQQPLHNGGTRDGFDAVVSGHLLVRYRDANDQYQTLKRPGAGSCFMPSSGDAIKGASSKAIGKAFSLLGCGHELYGTDAPRRADLSYLTDALPRITEQASASGEGDTPERKRAAGGGSLDRRLQAEARLWCARHDQTLSGAALAVAFRTAHGYPGEGELQVSEKAALIVEAIERRWGAREDTPPGASVRQALAA